MRPFRHRRRIAATRRVLAALSDHQLKDIGLRRSDIDIEALIGANGWSAPKRRRAAVGSGDRLPAGLLLSVAALILLIASAATMFLVDAPIVDMRLQPETRQSHLVGRADGKETRIRSVSNMRSGDVCTHGHVA